MELKNYFILKEILPPVYKFALLKNILFKRIQGASLKKHLMYPNFISTELDYNLIKDFSYLTSTYCSTSFTDRKT
jgi:hypothetical protein